MNRYLIDFADTDVLTLSPTEDTSYTIQVKGGEQGKKLLTVSLEHPHLSCKIYCGYTATLEAAFDLVTTIIHKAPTTECTTVIRGVLYSGGISKYQGKVIIEKTAQGSLSILDDRTLVVGEGTRSHAEPIMQIEANDVVASHASTIGCVDEWQLYYLQSRGLASEEARDLLIEAFLSRAELLEEV